MKRSALPLVSTCRAWCGLRKAIALFAFSSGMMRVKARSGQALSMQTRANSQPAPWPLARALLCPLWSPVMRWPTWWKRPNFLVSMWMEFAGMLALVAPHRLGLVEISEATEAGGL